MKMGNIGLGDMMNELNLIKKNLEEYIGKELYLKFNRGRKREDTYKGVLEKTYQSIFVIRITDNASDKVVSFTYADVFTKNIEIIFDNVKKVSNQ